MPRPRPSSAGPQMTLLRRHFARSTPATLRDDILVGGMEKEHRDRLIGALDLDQRTVDEIMRHRRQIEMIDADATPDAILTQILASPYTRLPVYRGTEENILGVVHAKDLLREVDRLVRGEGEGLAALDIEKVAM